MESQASPTLRRETGERRAVMSLHSAAWRIGAPMDTALTVYRIQVLEAVLLAFAQAQKNVVLEERVQVLQQQNEDLKARIDRNLVTSRCV